MAKSMQGESGHATEETHSLGDAYSEKSSSSSSSSSAMSRMPEAVLAVILSHTTAREVRRLATVSKAFAEAASSDLVWQKFLPADYREIAAKALYSDRTTPLRWGSLRELYVLLCNHVFLGNGKEGYWIDIATGGSCRSYSARLLNICWGSNETYWNWLPDKGCRFKEIAYLRMIWCLDISGQVKVTLPPGNYTFSWIFQFDWASSSEVLRENRSRLRNPRRVVLEGAEYDRWGTSVPLSFRATHMDKNPCDSQIRAISLKDRPPLRNTECLGSFLVLDPFQSRIHTRWCRPVNFSFTDGIDAMESSVKFPPTHGCGARQVDHLNRWEYDAGQFVVSAEGEREVQLSFSLKEVDCTSSKSGLYIYGVVIRPTPTVKNLRPFGGSFGAFL